MNKLIISILVLQIFISVANCSENNFLRKIKDEELQKYFEQYSVEEFTRLPLMTQIRLEKYTTEIVNISRGDSDVVNKLEGNQNQETPLASIEVDILNRPYSYSLKELIALSERELREVNLAFNYQKLKTAPLSVVYGCCRFAGMCWWC